MGRIISATTRFTGSGGGGRRSEFILKAQALLGQAVEQRAAGQWDLALESAYQAALRTAGARISASPVATRRGRPSGAWDQLRLVDAEGQRWALVFGRYSRTRSRVASGLERDVDPAVVGELIALATEFLLEVEAESGWVPTAA